MRGGQSYRILSQVDADMIASPFGGEPIAPEDAYACLAPSARVKALAAAEWRAMDNRGQLPADWPEQRAELERALDAAQEER